MTSLADAFVDVSERSRSYRQEKALHWQKPEWVVDPSESLIDSAAHILQNPFIRQCAEIDMHERYNEIVTIAIQDKSEEEKANWMERKTDEFSLFLWGNKTGNEFRRALVEQNEFGLQYAVALTDARYEDHSAPHARPVESAQATFLFLADPIDDEDGVSAIASGMFAYAHDIMQLMRRVYNDTIPEELRQDPRMLHEEEAAIFIKACTKLIAKCGHMTEAFAAKVTSALATMILMHDKHDRVRSLMTGMAAADISAQRSYQSDQLQEAYNAHQLNFLALSDAQWVMWYEAVRNERYRENPTKMPDEEHSFYGLIPWAADVIGEEYVMMKSRHEPINEHISDRHFEVFRAYEYINILGDIFNMGYPAIYAFLRKYCGSVKDRSMVQVVTDLIDATDAKKSDFARSDWARSMVEYVLMIEFLKETPFWNNTNFQETAVNTLLINLLQTDLIYEALLEDFGVGHKAQWQDVQDVGTVQFLTVLRAHELALKAIDKHGGVPEVESTILKQQIKADITIQSIRNRTIAVLKKYIPSNPHTDNYAGRFNTKILNIIRIRDLVSERLHEKKPPEIQNQEDFQLFVSRGVRRLKELPENIRRKFERRRKKWEGYSSKDIKECRSNVIGVIRYILQAVGAVWNEDDIINFFELVRTGQMAGVDAFAVSTTTLGDLEDSSTIHPPGSMLTH